MSRVIRRRTVPRKDYWPILRPEITVVIPVLDESDNVLVLVNRLYLSLAKYKAEILFVDDSLDSATTDAVDLARKIYRSKTFNVLSYHRKGSKRWGGLSGAVADGMKRAKSDKVIIMDGDLQHPPETIPDMIKASEEKEVVVASRYCKGGSAGGLDGKVRHLVSRSSTILAKAFFPFRLRNVSDPMTGFFLMDRTKIDGSRLRPKGFKILLEILATHPELKVTEVPLQFAERTAGESHGTLKQGTEFVSQLIGLRINQVFRNSRFSKFIQFGAIGGSVFIIGMALLYCLVDVFHWSPLSANAVQLAVTFWLNYILNLKITWRERKVTSFAVYKFIVSRIATTLMNFGMFAWLISQHYSLRLLGISADISINYLTANVITLVTVMMMNYIVSDKWAFANQRNHINFWQALARLFKHIPSSTYLAIFFVAIANSIVLFGFSATLSYLLASASIILFSLSSFEVWRMVYTFREPESVDRLRFPDPNGVRERFCIIVPARHEAAVLGDTLYQLAKQTHPNVRIIAVICDDDYETLKVANNVASNEQCVEVMSYPLTPGSKPSKPKQLNYVFNKIKNQKFSIIGIVDAEDTVQPELLMHIDAAFRNRETGIVQGGVQLVNHDSSWYSLHNVLEYYRWFKSTMAYQADHKFMPLGGNTIFIRKSLLKKVGGWPDTLTEDCSLGVLLSAQHQTKIAVYYEPGLATLEETPETLGSLFKQRVRWSQGFFHEWRVGEWRNLPTLRQRVLANYILFGPVLLAGISLLMPLSLIAFLFMDTPVLLAMLMNLPLVPASLGMAMSAVMLHDFGKDFSRSVKIRHYLLLCATQVAYQIILSIASLWAIVRDLRGVNSWHKTVHSGQHRPEPAYALAGVSTTAELSSEDSDG